MNVKIHGMESKKVCMKNKKVDSVYIHAFSWLSYGLLLFSNVNIGVRFIHFFKYRFIDDDIGCF